jgi:hypothetical protein
MSNPTQQARTGKRRTHVILDIQTKPEILVLQHIRGLKNAAAGELDFSI